MIGSLRGVVLERTSDSTVLLEVGGVGYLVHVTPRTLGELEPTSKAFLYVHHHVREDAQTLYAFLDRDERKCFEVLVGTHGVGPTMAMAVLATHSPRALVDIVAGADIAALTLVSGVGKKTAERLVIELKDKIGGDRINLSSSDHGFKDAKNEAFNALLVLGYKSHEAKKALETVDPSIETVEEILKVVLKSLHSK